MKYRTLTEDEMKQLEPVYYQNRDPEFLAFYERLLKDRRLIVEGLTHSQITWLHRKHPHKLHVHKNGAALVVFLDPDV